VGVAVGEAVSQFTSNWELLSVSGMAFVLNSSISLLLLAVAAEH
jgi:hypothetical protein